MKQLFIPIVVLITITATAGYTGNQAPTFTSSKDIFQTAYFLKNIPGLINDCDGKPIRYFASHDGVTVYLTDQGPIYKLVTRDEKKAKELEKERERNEKKGIKVREEEERSSPLLISYTKAFWIGSNPNPVIEAVNKNTGYYTYLAGHTKEDMHSLQTDGYSKLVCHDVYPGIDVEYSFPERGGMKYNLIVHPGADPSRIQMSYTGPSIQHMTTDHSGNMTIHTETGDMVDHTPVSYTADGQKVSTAYHIDGNKVTFSLSGAYDHNQTLTIDPWVTTMNQLTVRNLGADVDYDVLGNLYVYGAGGNDVTDTTNYQKLAKFDPAGTFLWVFNGSVSSVGWNTTGSLGLNPLSNAKIDKTTTKAYMGQISLSGGAQLVRINSAGAYDNFISTQDSLFQEVWSFVANCNTGEVLALGGGTNSNLNMGVVNPSTGLVATTNFTGITGSYYQDIVSGVYDPSGRLYVLMASTGTTSIDNTLLKVNTAYNGSTWGPSATGMTSFSEVNNMPAYDWFNGASSNNFNALAANSNYLYYYDGKYLKAFSLTTGAAVGTRLRITGYTALSQGGIAVDHCDHVYIGGQGVIKTYTFNGSTFTAGANISLGAGHTNDTIFDLRYDANTNLLYAAGTSIVGTYTATLSTTCVVNYNYTDTVTPKCLGGVVRVTPGLGLVNPVYSFQWRDSLGNVIRQSTPSTALVDSFTATHAGRYTVAVQLNVNCGGTTHIDTFHVVDCTTLLHSPDTTICAGQSDSLWAKGSPTGGTYLWTPGGATTSSIVVTPAASTIYTVKYTPTTGSSITDTIRVTVTNAVTSNVNSVSICPGDSAVLKDTVSLTGGTYLWSPGGATTSGITVRPATTSTYTVTYSTLHCGTSTRTATVTVYPTPTTPINRAICTGDSTLFGGHYYSAAGTYRDTLTTTHGCDSIIVLTLSVKPLSASSIAHSICPGTTYSFNGQSLTTAGVYKDTLTGINGCDSIVTLTLSILSTSRDSITRSICSGSSFNFNGRILTTAGVYKDTLTNYLGCDSFVTLRLNVVSVLTTALNRSICNGNSITFNGQTITTAGTYRDTLTSSAGCDSIVTLTVAVASTSSYTFSRTLCSGDSITFHSQTIQTAGTYHDTLTNTAGCDSFVTMNLSIIQPARHTITTSICLGSSYSIGGQSFSTSGQDSVRLVGAAANGCDSTIVLHLTVLQPDTNIITTAICTGISYSIGGQSFNTQGMHSVTLTGAAANTCDSIITLNLTVNQPATHTINAAICQGSTYTAGGQTFSTAGQYTVTLSGAAVNTCDSIITLNLTINQPSTNNITTAICAGSSYTVGSQTYNTTGLYTVVLTGASANGCDSTVNLNLTVNQPDTNIITTSICAGSSYTAGGQSFNATGQYSVSLTAASTNGCDSVIILNLTVIQPSTYTITTSICAGTSYTVGSQSFNTTGQYNVTLTGAAASGCDSIVTLNLTAIVPDTTAISQSICYHTNYNFYGRTLTASGIYIDTMQSVVTGCDSIIVLTLTVMPALSSSISQLLCDGASITFHQQSISTAGVYLDTVTASTGCDSVLTLTVTTAVSTVDTIRDTICSNQSYSFFGTSYNTAGTYSHTLPNIAGCDSLVTLILTVKTTSASSRYDTICSNSTYNFYGQSLNTTGSYTHTLTNAVGCDSIETLYLTVTPTSTTTINQTICSGTTITFQGQVLSTTGTYQYTLTNAGGCDSFLIFNLTVTPPVFTPISHTICTGDTFGHDGHTYTTAGIYNDTLHTIVGGCDSIIVLTLTTKPRPVAGFVIQPLGERVELGTISVTDHSTHTDSVLWQLNTVFVDLSTHHGLPIYEPGNYCIKLTAISDAGCSDTSTQCIYVYQDAFYIPNAFTPNSDGHNDYLEIYGTKESMKYVSMTVFNRWGERVFESNDVDFQWDGTFKGEKQEPGVYVYTLEITYRNGNVIHNKGAITLIR